MSLACVLLNPNPKNPICIWASAATSTARGPGRSRQGLEETRGDVEFRVNRPFRVFWVRVCLARGEGMRGIETGQRLQGLRYNATLYYIILYYIILYYIILYYIILYYYIYGGVPFQEGHCRTLPMAWVWQGLLESILARGPGRRRGGGSPSGRRSGGLGLGFRLTHSHTQAWQVPSQV